jgi:hypothetical protein
MEIIKPEDIQLAKFLGAGGYGEVHISILKMSQPFYLPVCLSVCLSVNCPDCAEEVSRKPMASCAQEGRPGIAY